MTLLNQDSNQKNNVLNLVMNCLFIYQKLLYKEGFSLEVANIKENFVSYLYDIRFIIFFYVIGDWASTVFALPFGVEYNTVPAMILERHGIYSLLLPKIVIILLLFYIAPTMKLNKYVWPILKHTIELIGILVTLNNLMVIFIGYSLVQAVGLV